VNVHIPRDKLTKEHNGYGFVEFKTEQDADYAIRIMNLIKLYGKPLRLNKVLVCRSLSLSSSQRALLCSLIHFHSISLSLTVDIFSERHSNFI
jgi:RNA recognition motif-containing protein